MLYRQMGSTGLRISAYALGTNAFGGRADEPTSINIIHHAIDQGITLIDTANQYTGGRSEEIIGKAVRDRRDRVIVATKVGMKSGRGGVNDASSSRWSIRQEVEGSLRRLQTDYIDLYQIHQFDPHTPIEETLRTLDDLVRQGTVRYVGCSNYAAWQLTRALWLSERHNLVRYETVQPPYSPADRRIERELVPCCLDQGVGMLVYFPLAGGVLTGKYRPDSPPPQDSRAVTQAPFADRLTQKNLQLAQAITELSAEIGVTVAQLTLAWVIHRPGVTSALIGATKVPQQEENLRCLDIDMTDELMERINTLSDDFVNF
ncbi:MAG: aldo/keto reductase [Thermaerobacterales bacterium]